MEKGKTYLNSGNIEEAKKYFNKAVGLVFIFKKKILLH
jgi:hypothetical protein